MIYQLSTLKLLSELLWLKYSGALACRECFPHIVQAQSNVLIWMFLSISDGSMLYLRSSPLQQSSK